MRARVAVVAACGVDIGDMAFAQARHLHYIAGVAPQGPSRLHVHDMFEFGLLLVVVGDVVSQEHQLHILRGGEPFVVGTAPRRSDRSPTDVLVLRLGFYRCFQILIEPCVVACFWADEVGGIRPQLAESLPAAFEDQRMVVGNLALGDEDILPLCVAREVVEIRRRHLSEVAARHADIAYALVVVELLFLLP